MGWVILFDFIGKSILTKKFSKLRKYFLIDNSLKIFKQSWLLLKKRIKKISFLYTRNDGSISSIKVLTKLKILFSIQLPNIPDSYIGKQILDKKHVLISLVRINRDKKIIVGSCCFRIFESHQFIELIFFAVSTKVQGSGHGALLMSFLKDFARSRKASYILTCADNNAINFFLKQGFSEILTNPIPIWFRHIREYEEIELMECVVCIKNSFFFSYLDLILQRTFFLSKYQFLKTSKLKKLKKTIRNPIIFKLSSKISEKQNPEQFKTILFSIIDNLKSIEIVSPFFEPVDTRKMGISNYFEQITNPIDIRSIEEKIRSGKIILTKTTFLHLMKRMLNNSILYNGQVHSLKEICSLLKKKFYFPDNFFDCQRV